MDVKTLKKGDTISPKELEKMFNSKRTTPEYRLQLIELQVKIQEESNKNDDPLLCRTEKEALIIMTDSEAARYKADQHRQAVMKIYRSLRHLSRVDTNNLTSQEAQKYERDVINQSRIAQAVKRERRRF